MPPKCTTVGYMDVPWIVVKFILRELTTKKPTLLPVSFVHSDG